MKTVGLCLLLATLVLVPLVIAGCDPVWSVTVKAWLDTNGNGRLDPGEKPLSGIPFHGVIVRTSQAVTVTTNANGEASLLIGFTNLKGEVYPDVPSQYTLTTLDRYRGSNTTRDRPILFGFAYAAGVTPTPRPPVSVACTRWEIERGQADSSEIRDISLAPDGSAWVIANWPVGGYVHVRPDDPPGKLALTPVAQKYPRHIAVAADGDAWLATDEGLVRIQDGTQRVYLGAPFAEESDSLLDVAPLSDGNVLVSGWHGGIALFDPDRASWTTRPLSTTQMIYFRWTNDGAIWGVNMGESVYLVPLVKPTGQVVDGVAPMVVQIPRLEQRKGGGAIRRVVV